MEKAYVTRRRKSFSIGNGFLQRTIDIADGKLKTINLQNKLTGTRFETNSKEFLIKINDNTILTNKDFCAGRATTGRAARGGQRLLIVLHNEKHDLGLEVSYEIRAKDFYIRKQLKVLNKENLINEIHVEVFTIKGARDLRYGGFGQPIFVGNELFLGLEYPAGYNKVDKQRRIDLYHYPGRTGTVKSKKAVLGVSPNTVNNRIRDSFLKYIELNRARPIRGFFSEYVNMSGRRRATDIRTWCFDVGEEMFLKQGLPISSVIKGTHQSWIEPKSVMREKPEREHSIPVSLLRKEARKKLGAGIGFHVNTGGGRGSSDHTWFAQHFDMITSRYYCLADPRAKEELKKSLLHLLKKYRANAFWFDWLWWTTAWECPRSNHRGHIKGRRYGREAITDSMIEILQALRKETPDAVLHDLEVDLGPWWLFHAEALWSYSGEGDGLSHEFIDGSTKKWLKKHTIFPMSDIFYGTSFPFGVGKPERKGQLDFKELLDSIVMSYMRGSQLEEIYFHLKNFTAREKKAYARIMKWARARQDILLANTTFILRGPAKWKTYGLSHFKEDNSGIIGLYNPAHWRTEKVRIILDEKANFYERGERCAVKIVYPYIEILDGLYDYGDAIELEVQGSQVMVLETIPYSKIREPLLAGCRYGYLKDGCFRLLGLPRQKRTLTLLNSETVDSIRIDDKKLSGTRWRVELKGKRIKAFNLTDIDISEDGTAMGNKLSLEFRIDVPENERTRLSCIVDIDYNEEQLTELEGEELENQVRKSMKKRGMIARDDRQEAAGMLRKKLFFEKTRDSVDFLVKNSGDEIELEKNVYADKRIARIGPHPYRKSRGFSRTWAKSGPLCSGKVDFAVSVKWPTARISIWLDREIRLSKSQTVSFTRTTFNEDDIPADNWLDKQRITLNLVDNRRMG